MNRTIKFRGKRCKDGEWVYGSYVESNTSWNGYKPHKSWILPSPMTNGGWFSIRGAYPVIDETVCQFTGLVDKNGKEIYEKDIVFIFGRPSVVVFSKGSFRFDRPYGLISYCSCQWCVDDCVIGNVFENEHLLKGSNNG